MPKSSWVTQPLPSVTDLFAPAPLGWLGGDSAASCALNATHLLWLWGDTLLGTSTGGRRKIQHFVHGSIALQQRTIGVQPAFYVRTLADGTPDPDGFFQPGGNSTAHGGIYYWMVNEAALTLPAEEVEQPLLLLAQTMSPSGFLRQLGTDAVLLFPQPTIPPDRWRYQTSRIPASSPNVSFNTGVLLDPDGMVYLLGGRTAHAFGPVVHQLLARIARADLLAFRWSTMRFWGGEATGWVESIDAAAAIINASYTEGSLGRYAPGGPFYFVSLQAYEPSIMIYTAPRLTGPWTAAPLYTLPPLPANATLAYAAKSHPALRDIIGSSTAAERPSAETLIVSYNTNAQGLAPLEASAAVYHPLFVKARLNCSAATEARLSLPACAASPDMLYVGLTAAGVAALLVGFLLGGVKVLRLRSRRAQRDRELLAEAKSRRAASTADGDEPPGARHDDVRR